MDTLLLFVALGLALTWATPAGAAEAPLRAWACDPLEKVFPDAAAPEAPGTISLSAARGQTQGGQLAVAVSTPAKATLVPEDLVGPDGHRIAAERVRWSFEGFIPIQHNSANTPESELLRKAPCEVPDVLLPDREMQLAPGRTQPVWVGVDVPDDCAPGDYKGRIVVRAAGQEAAVPLEVHVYDFALPKERHLWVTNWFNLPNIAKAHKVEIWSEPFWQMLAKYARCMAEQRQNVALVPLSLVQITRAAGGRLQFDWARFDRYVRLFQEAGAAERLELGHVASHGEGGWSSKEIVLRPVDATDAATGKTVKLGPDDGLAPLLRALEEHLRAQGWLAQSMIHIADEPAFHNLASWRQASEFVHRNAPGIRRIDAIEATGFDGALEVWVPKLTHLSTWWSTYRQAQSAGAEMWYYTCCHPTGLYPNRFLDYALVKTRALHWINYAFDLPGYLHWGLNFWGDDPFGAPRENLPPGDTHIIYPGPDGPLSSLRREAMREGIEDFEWLHLLAERTATEREHLGKPAEGFDAAEGTHAYARLIAHSLSEVETSPVRFRSVRDQLAREIESAGQAPYVLLATDPPAGGELVPGPIVVLLRGVCEPGATVKVGGEPVEVAPDGTFRKGVGLSAGRPSLTVEVTKDGKTKRVVRTFRVKGA